MTPIFKEYCFYLTKYKEKYGEQTVVLMQVGSFYEIYAILNEKEQLGEINIYHICQNLMNIAVAKKTNKILMGGFQLPYSGKFIKLLVDHNYTIVLVHQITEKPNIERKMVEVISPGTYTEDFNNEVNNFYKIATQEYEKWGLRLFDKSIEFKNTIRDMDTGD